MRFWFGQVVKRDNRLWVVAGHLPDFPRKDVDETVDLVPFDECIKVHNVPVCELEPVADTVASFLTKKFKSLFPEIYDV